MYGMKHICSTKLVSETENPTCMATNTYAVPKLYLIRSSELGTGLSLSVAAYALMSVAILGLVVTKTFRETRPAWVFALLVLLTLCLGWVLVMLQVRCYSVSKRGGGLLVLRYPRLHLGFMLLMIYGSTISSATGVCYWRYDTLDFTTTRMGV